MSSVMGSEVERAFLIADLAGYTALTEAHGNVEAAKIVTRYVEIAREVLDRDARLIERVGDQLLVASETPAPAIVTGVKLVQAVEAEPLFPAVRAGLHVGQVLDRDGQYFGAGLNLTARVAAYARPGQLLCTEKIAARAIALGVDCHPLGDVRFKNVTEPVRVYDVLVSHRGEEARAIDPVCRMQVDTARAPGRLTRDGVTFWFCSFACARAFALRPEDYLPPPSGNPRAVEGQP